MGRELVAVTMVTAERVVRNARVVSMTTDRGVWRVTERARRGVVGVGQQTVTSVLLVM